LSLFSKFFVFCFIFYFIYNYFFKFFLKFFLSVCVCVCAGGDMGEGGVWLGARASVRYVYVSEQVAVHVAVGCVCVREFVKS
jgi:hypothetical protein